MAGAGAGAGGPRTGAGAATGAGGDPYAAFVPRRGPRVAVVMAAGVALMFVWLALFVVGAQGWGDRFGFLVVGAVVVWFLVRQALVRAVPGRTHLEVRNLVVRRAVAWGEITGVQFGGGRPWVQLELSDGDTLAVMGIQRADGPRAEAEAQRLATLVAAHAQRSAGG